MQRHIIVSGDDALATTIADELKNAGAVVVRIVNSDQTEAGVARELALADVSHALAVVCAGDDDAVNLEIALLARKSSPDVRVVSRVANDVLREAVATDNGPGAIFDVADLAAPAIVEACLSQATHEFDAAGMKFVVSGKTAYRDATLRELYGDLAPVAVIHSEDSPTPGEVEICPGRDQHVHAGDWTIMIGTAQELAAQGIKTPGSSRSRSRRTILRRTVDSVRGVINDFNPTFYPVAGATLIVLITATFVLRFGYQPPPKMGWVDAFYFTVETMTTTGYGDFSFVNQPTWLRTFSTLLMFSGVTTTALLVSFVADVLLSRRFVFASNRPRVRHLRNHIVVVGLSGLGIRVVKDLTTAGYDVAVIEQDEENRFLSAVRDLDVPVIFGDATLRQTLLAARVDRARAVAVLTRNDMINIETGIVLTETLGTETATRKHWTPTPLVLRVYDRTLGLAVAQRFGFENVRSTVELAVPYFIGAAIGLQVLGTFSVGQSSFVVGGMQVAAGSELDGLRMFELSTQARASRS
jgi:Trk K+ transport system NAD-binding subunit